MYSEVGLRCILMVVPGQGDGHGIMTLQIAVGTGIRG